MQCQLVLPFWDTAFSKVYHENPRPSTHWSLLRPGLQSICLVFESWQLDHFWLRCSKFHIWPWNFKVKDMAKVTIDGHIWGLKLKQYVCFSFRGKRDIFDWELANPIFVLENSRSRWWSHLRPWVQSICLLFVSWQSDYFGYNKLHIWPWQLKVKITTKIDQNLIR